MCAADPQVHDLSVCWGLEKTFGFNPPNPEDAILQCCAGER